MRNLILLTLLASALGSTSAMADDKHDKTNLAPPIPIATTAEGKIYGAAWPDQPNTLTLDAAAIQVAELNDKPQAFSGRITEVCQKMGCWMVLSGEKGQFARVFMHDHSYSIPKDSSGLAVVYGTLTEKEVSAKEAAHLVADGAKPAAAKELQIDALSVLIRSEG